jgi:hypothetical protein
MAKRAWLWTVNGAPSTAMRVSAATAQDVFAVMGLLSISCS